MATSYPQLVLLGDSLFQNSMQLLDGFSFHVAVQNACARRLDVVNRGFSGWNTNNVVKYLDKIFPELSPGSPKMEYLFILLGANDAVLPWASTKQHVPIEQYKKNLVKIIEHPRIQAHSPKIFLVTPPPLDELKCGKLDISAGHPSSIRLSAVSTSYSEKAREVARERVDVVLVDLWKALMDKAISMAPNDFKEGGPWLGSPENGKSGGLDELLPDGLHMNGEAYRVLFETLQPLALKKFTDAPAGEGFVYPTWKQLNDVE